MMLRLRLLAVVGGRHTGHKVSGIRATLGVRSGTASLEKFSYDSAPPTSGTGSRLRLHLTIDQSFKDRLAQAKKTSSAVAGQWSPISPTPNGVASTSGDFRLWDAGCPDNLITDLVGVLGRGDHTYTEVVAAATTTTVVPVEQFTTSATATTTPADLSDLGTVDLLHFPADWNVELSDVDVDADFSPLTDVRSSVVDLDSLCLPFGTECSSDDHAGFLGAPLPTVSDLFPVYDDIFSSYGVGGEAPMFEGGDDMWWSAPNIGHAISVQ